MIIFDIEADGFLADLTKIHCINAYSTDTDAAYRFNDAGTWTKDGSVSDGLALLQQANEIGGHNVHEYDILAIQKLYPKWQPRGVVHDSRAYCRLLWPDIKDRDFAALRRGVLPFEFQKQGLIGMHSLKAWGYRLGVHKGEFEGPWDAFTQVMDDYCMQDVHVTAQLFEKIASKRSDPRALEIENHVARLIVSQERYGFGFDVPAAERLTATLQVRRLQLESELRTAFQPWYRPVFVKGNSTFIPKRDNKRQGYLADTPCTKIEYTEFNPASRDHISDRLTALFGWKPVEFAANGKPKIDETTLDGMEFPQAKLLKEYLTVEKRLGQIAEGREAWLKAVGKDGRIHGRVNTCGAVTGRMTHYGPNVAQVPRVGSPYGRECRALFCASRKGYVQVGCDAEGLELRCLAHYMAQWDDGAYGRAVVEGKKEDSTDVHSITKQVLTFNSRDNAKTWMYAYLYGAGDFKLGTLVVADFTETKRERFYAKYPAGSEREKAVVRLGRKTRDQIADGLPALSKLTATVKAVAKKRGHLIGLDGRHLVVRSEHAALNTLLQSAGAVAMKKALLILDAHLQADGLVPGEDYGFMANVHDEFQLEVKEKNAEQVGKTAADAIRAAGEYFKFRCPLAGDYVVGKTWADTH